MTFSLSEVIMYITGALECGILIGIMISENTK